MRFDEKIKQMLGKAASEIGQELGRLGVQGQAEFGSALFTGSAYVPYGQGQNRDGTVHGTDGPHQEGSRTSSVRTRGVRCNSTHDFELDVPFSFGQGNRMTRDLVDRAGR